NVTGLAGNVTKTYDATTAATLGAGNYTTDRIGGDTVNVSTAAGTYDNKNAGVGKTVSVNGLAINGADAGNYNLVTNSVSGNVGANYSYTFVNSANGAITKAALGITARDIAMIYADGTILNGVTGFTATGLAGGETVGSVTLATNAATSSSGNWNAGVWTLT